MPSFIIELWIILRNVLATRHVKCAPRGHSPLDSCATWTRCATWTLHEASVHYSTFLIASGTSCYVSIRAPHPPIHYSTFLITSGTSCYVSIRAPHPPRVNQRAAARKTCATLVRAWPARNRNAHAYYIIIYTRIYYMYIRAWPARNRNAHACIIRYDSCVDAQCTYLLHTA